MQRGVVAASRRVPASDVMTTTSSSAGATNARGRQRSEREGPESGQASLSRRSEGASVGFDVVG